MIPLTQNANIDNSDPANYPDGRIKDNTGTGNGTPVNRNVYGDIHSNISKLLRLYSIQPNQLPDNETNGFQIIEALVALSTKNTIVSDISTTGGVLVAAMKLNKLKVGEKMYCHSSCDFTTETTIKGNNVATTYTATVVGDFVIGEYVELVKTNTGIELRRVIDQGNLDTIVTSIGFLKAASYAEEIAGTIDNKATNPLSNTLAFVERVNGASSAMSLATAIRNGLYPKEHFAIVAGMTNPVKNIGTVSGLNIGESSIGSTKTVTGDIFSCTVVAQAGEGTTYRVVLNNTMGNTSYYVRHFIQGMSTNIGNDAAIGNLIFSPINATVFDFNITEFAAQAQNLKIHFEVVKI